MKPKIKISLEVRIPGQAINRFDVDSNMRLVALATASGNVLIYDLAKAVENERLIAKKKIQMGVETQNVYTYLEQVGLNEFDNECPLSNGVNILDGIDNMTNLSSKGFL